MLIEFGKIFPPAPQAEAIYLELNIYADANGGNRLSQRRVQVSEAASLRWEELGIQLMAEQNGFAEVLIINEGTSNSEVYADNLSLQITSAQQVAIVQENHYLPFGLAAIGLDYTESGHKPDRFLFNEDSERVAQFNLQWDFTAWRPYDYQLGRRCPCRLGA